MKTLHSIFFLILTCAGFTAAAQQDNRQQINFDDDWRFHLGHAADPQKDFNFKIANIFSKTGKADETAIDAKFNDTAWRMLDLPHDWAVELPFVNSANVDVMGHGYKPIGGLFPETSVGWYRKHFRINKADSGQRFQLQFDGIFRDAIIWVNGFYLGNNKSGYLGMEYDITDYINYNGDNVVVVRADATQSEGWFYEGAGIYRHAWLNKFSNIAIVHDGVFAYTTIKDNQAVISIETNIANSGLSAGACTVSALLTDRDGRTLAQTDEQAVQLSINEGKTIKQQLSLDHPRLWSLEDPYLYRIIPIIKIDGKQTDRASIKIGMRAIAVTDHGVYLNGEYLKIKGANNHQDHAGVGSALPDELQYYRVRLLKELGVNAWRTSHHAPAPELLDACDSLGMLVLDEQRLMNSSPEYMNEFTRLLKRDRSRACVFMWSIGNEEQTVQSTSIGKRLAQSFITKQVELDPTRTCTYAADLGNTFRGVNEVIPVRGFNYRHLNVTAYHSAHPAQPVIGTEMGSTVSTRGIYAMDSIKAYLPDQDINAPWWASTAEAWWPPAADNQWMLGGFIWTGFDYRGEPTPFQWPNINSHFGVMDICGFPKNIYYYYQSWWTNKDVLHISPHWNWKGKEGKPIDVWVNSNADNVELFLNGKSLGKKQMPVNGHLQWTVNYQPGRLLAVGYKKQQKIIAQTETTGAPFGLKISSSKTSVLADGHDATIINITAMDQQGREVPDAANLVNFSVEGDAKIVGVGNGDPSSHEQDKYNSATAQRHLFNGKCQVILLVGKTAGDIKFTAVSAGLQESSVRIQGVQAQD